MNYYNDIEPFVCEWASQLIAARLVPDGTVDSRSIRELKPNDLQQYQQCHFFAGVLGWSEALRLAGWPRGLRIWSGSCPCQPFSSAGKRKGKKDERHLWPAFYRHIAECRPPVIIGEQVASADGREWLAGVRADLEALGYEVGAADLCSAGAGAPHIRQRLYWVADTCGQRRQRKHSLLRRRSKARGRLASNSPETAGGGEVGRLADADSPLFRGGSNREGEGTGGQLLVGGSGPQDSAGGLGDSDDSGPQGQRGSGNGADECTSGQTGLAGFWSRFAIANCTDSKARRFEPESFPLAHGIPSRNSDPRLGFIRTRLQQLGIDPKSAARILREAKRNRVGRLRGFGNAIAPELAAEFISAYMESRGIAPQF